MAQFGLGFSQQEVNRKCRTVLYRDRYKNSKFKSLGNNVMRRMKVVRSMENVDTETFPDPALDKHQPQEAVTIIIGGESRDWMTVITRFNRLTRLCNLSRL